MARDQPQPIAIMATDGEDLEVLSALLQDAIIYTGETSWRPQDRRFAMLVNRFLWEEAGKKGRKKTHHRVRAGLHFNHVRGVRAQGLDPDDRTRLLNLMSLTADESEEGARITLICSDGVTIELDAECIDAGLADLSDMWETPAKPDHDLED